MIKIAGGILLAGFIAMGGFLLLVYIAYISGLSFGLMG